MSITTYPYKYLIEFMYTYFDLKMIFVIYCNKLLVHPS